jgi:hypothetical protein
MTCDCGRSFSKAGYAIKHMASCSQVNQSIADESAPVAQPVIEGDGDGNDIIGNDIIGNDIIGNDIIDISTMDTQPAMACYVTRAEFESLVAEVRQLKLRIPS